jgi:hypothetical protein
MEGKISLILFIPEKYHRYHDKNLSPDVFPFAAGTGWVQRKIQNT